MNVLYRLNPESEKALWENAIFIFDSSALLNFYFLPLPVRKSIFNDLFAIKLKDRLWIPAHVKYEYLKNKEKVINKPINENYAPLESNIKKIKNAFKDIEGQLQDLKNRTSKEDKHPYLPQQEIDGFIIKKDIFKTDLFAFENTLRQDISDAAIEINKVLQEDDVDAAINTLFLEGRYYTFEEIMAIVVEGRLRYEYSIPPGYKDLTDKDKKGTQIFGDLIIWKQILEFAKEVKKPIIFICDDLKEDWCYVEDEEKRVQSPREELIKEMADFANVNFWMYSQPQFLYHANHFLEAKIEEQNIEKLSNLINPLNRSIRYISWGDSKWEARFAKLQCVWSRDGLAQVSTPIFLHRGKESNSEHSDDHINYLNEAGEWYSAKCRAYYENTGEVWFKFLIAKNGGAYTEESESIKFKDWDGKSWNATLSPLTVSSISYEEDINFICEPVPD